MRPYPKISIVIHCFNRESLIKETLESVLSQGYPNLELIVIDDGSTDHSWEIIQSYRDKVAYMERLSGSRDSPVIALNTGFSHATGDILTWLNTKNILLHKSLFIIAEIFETLPEVRWLTGLGTVIDERGYAIRVTLPMKNKYDYLIGKCESIQQESTFWRKSLWDETGGKMDPKYKWHFDAGLWVKFFQKTELYQICTIIGAYRHVPKISTSRDKPDLFKAHTGAILRDMRFTAHKRDLRLSYWYRVVYACRHVLVVLPDTIYMRIPFLNVFNYPRIEYAFESGIRRPRIRRTSPFRKRL